MSDVSTGTFNGIIREVTICKKLVMIQLSLSHHDCQGTRQARRDSGHSHV